MRTEKEVERLIADKRAEWEAERVRRNAEFDAIEARRNAVLVRHEIVDAIATVAASYGSCGTHDGDMLCDAFRKLAEALA
jgi:hypothetical protein